MNSILTDSTILNYLLGLQPVSILGHCFLPMKQNIRENQQPTSSKRALKIAVTLESFFWMEKKPFTKSVAPKKWDTGHPHPKKHTKLSKKNHTSICNLFGSISQCWFFRPPALDLSASPWDGFFSHPMCRIWKNDVYTVPPPLEDHPS